MKPSYLQYDNFDALDLPSLKARLGEVAAFPRHAHADPDNDPQSSARWWTTGKPLHAPGWRQLQIRLHAHGNTEAAPWQRIVTMTHSTDRRAVSFEENDADVHSPSLGLTGEEHIRATVAAWRRALRLPAFMHPSGAPEIVDIAEGIARDVSAMLLQSGRTDHGVSSLDVTLPTIGTPGTLASSHGAQPLASAAIEAICARLPVVIGLKSGNTAGQYSLCRTSAMLRVDLPDLSAVEAMRAVTALPPELSRPTALARRLRA